MAVTQTQLDALDAAIAKGVLTIRDGEKTITYRSVDDMLAARAALVSLMATQANSTRAAPRYQLADFRDD
jgi:hypothetical protein